MVKISGTTGTLAQNARKTERERQQASHHRPKVSKMLAPMKIAPLKKGSLSGEEKDADKKAVSKEGAAGAHVKKIGKEHNDGDELSEEEDSDSEEEKAKNKKKDEKAKKKKKLIEHDFDPDDHNLTYAMRATDRRAIFYDEYESHVACFHELDIQPITADMKRVNGRLLAYTNELLTYWEPQKLTNTPKVVLDVCRDTSEFTNICISPLQAIRGWALLANVALNKTHVEIMEFISKYTTEKQIDSTTALNMEMLGMHVSAEEDFDGCVRIFTEIPHHLHHNEELRRRIDAFFGGKSRRAAIQHHSFATDSDGFYSCYRINQEMSLSTNGAVRYVVPETDAPNWRASVVVATAIDCTFYWKTDELAVETKQMKFNNGPNAFSLCTGFYVKATVLKNSSNSIYELSSHIEGVRLYICMEDPKDVNKEKKIDKSLLSEIYSRDTWSVVTTNILIPRMTTSTPISLRKHSKEEGLARVYCSEKSELHRLFSKDSAKQNSHFNTLFDHYHKANFEIVAAEPTASLGKQPFDDMGPSRAHQCIDPTIGKVFAKYQKKSQHSASAMFTYYEDHMDQNPLSVADTTNRAAVCATADDLVFDRPFYYIMTRIQDSQVVIVCAGYFNNTVWVKIENDERDEK